jgi:riboflavin-specific deaminase-like protein
MKSVDRNKNMGGASLPRPYLSRRRSRSHIQLPFIAVTFAMTVDGKVTTKNYASVDFTSREDKAHLIRQRALGDAVLVGHGTIENDNVRLGIPREELRKERIARGQPPYPIRVIVSNRGRINPRLKIFETDFAPIIIFSTIRMPLKTRKQLREKATLYLSQARRVDLRWMLQELRSDYKVKYVACEGGPALFRSLLEHGLVDQLNLTIAPFLFGGKNAPTLTGVSFDFLPHSVRCSLKEMRVVGDECFLTYRITQPVRQQRAQSPAAP